MPFLTRIDCPADENPSEFPLNLPFVPSLSARDIPCNVLFFVGENGSGKSTLLEAIGIAAKRVNIGKSDLSADGTLDAIRPLSDRLTLSWRRRSANGFFLRAEDFFNFIRRNQDLEKTFDGLIERFKDDDRVRGYMESNRQAINGRYGRDLNDYSHGEGFFEFVRSRVNANGLYLFDEPEAALSPQRQLAFALFVREKALAGCQFIIATHSPIILSCPDAEIWEFSEEGLAERSYSELEHVRFSKSFLADPQRYWRQLESSD
ncbi:AAA family ATPase [Pelagicoccus sp. SDUM812003]|uniref:AAA family ATPase n=1 Tax=Pelagicoccus sp. SDUM812003 TaxID=3041267 RepID=UPI00280DB111|nr:AAA family ATPase [Pelagicoccus sp. SDUM812003]MDQ8204479.1 AAA family ATPase [Pelagicoccus sp. SDUM812003]